MNKQQHTPGPWIQDKYGSVRGQDGESIVFRGVSTLCSGSDDRIAEAEANTTLACASPELLEALEDVRRRIKASDHWWIDCPDKGGFDAEMIDAVIARARGES